MRATGLVLLAIVLVTLAFLGLFGGLFFTQLAELVQQLPAIVTDIIDWLNSTFGLKLDPDNVLELLQISPSQITLVATNLAGGVLGVFGLLFGTLFDALTCSCSRSTSPPTVPGCAARSARGCR